MKVTAGFQMGLSMLAYDSYSSTQASFFWDTQFVEIGAKASSRLLGSLGVGRTEASNKLGNWDQTVSVELARRYLSADGRYGRLGLEYDQFSSSDDRFLHLQLDTGILESAEEPWALKLQFHLFHPLRQSLNTRLISGLDLGRVISQWSESIVKVGLGFHWTYHLTEEANLQTVQLLSDHALISEHMFFAWTPWVEYSSHRFIAKLGVPLRLFLDKSLEALSSDGGTTYDALIVSYPFQMASPDIWASLVFLL